jgi:hypothetical protein
MAAVIEESEVGRRYTDGEYLKHNPTWHVEDSPWKAEQIFRAINRNALAPQTVCEVGCGAGEVLAQLQQKLPDDCRFWGYDISPQAIAMSRQRANERLQFKELDLFAEPDAMFDLLLVIDLIEHLDDYYGFLRKLRSRGRYAIFHIPLDLSAYSVLRSYPILDLRASVGHIHYFTKDTALAALRETGYEVLDWFYPQGRMRLRGKPLRQRVLALLRKSLLHVKKDLAVRLLGGASLMVLARCSPSNGAAAGHGNSID